MPSEQFEKAFTTFDAYNSNDPNTEVDHGVVVPKELLYAQRMTDRLNHFSPDASTSLQLAARCQHIGRWEIPRGSYPMDRKGYLQWRTAEKMHQSKIAEHILISCRYDSATIEKVKSLLMKKGLNSDPDTQLLEDVICLVFIEHYLDDFAAKYDDDKVIDILQKTMKKMSKRGLEEAGKISLSPRMASLIGKAAEKL